MDEEEFSEGRGRFNGTRLGWSKDNTQTLHCSFGYPLLTEDFAAICKHKLFFSHKPFKTLEIFENAKSKIRAISNAD